MKILAHSDYQSPPESGHGVLVLANDVNALDVNLDGITQVDLQFPAFTDGRAFTQAYLLRRRRGFTGDIRATGDVLVDMLPMLQRTGFDAVQLRHDQQIEAAQRALGYFAGHYQGDVPQPKPAFARDLGAELAAKRQADAEQFAGQGI